MCDTASFDLVQGCGSKAKELSQKVEDIAKKGYSLGSLVTVTATDKIDNPDVAFKDLANTVKCFDFLSYYVWSFDLYKANIIKYSRL